jgi:hypothetical protein
MNVEFKKTWAEERQQIVNDYRAQFPEQQDWSMKDVASWAIRQGRWSLPNRNAIKICAGELSQASREEYYADPQGRRVRVKHARRETIATEDGPKQMVFWEDIRNSKPSHMRVSFQQRRTAILSDNAQLKRDADSYNENNPQGAFIQLSFDYSEDLLEMESSSEYGDFENQEPEPDEEE